MSDPKISGAQAMARISTLEAFVKVLIHREIVTDPGASKELLQALSDASKANADAIGHREMCVHADIHTSDFLEAIRNELGATS